MRMTATGFQIIVLYGTDGVIPNVTLMILFVMEPSATNTPVLTALQRPSAVMLTFKVEWTGILWVLIQARLTTAMAWRLGGKVMSNFMSIVDVEEPVHSMEIGKSRTGSGTQNKGSSSSRNDLIQDTNNYHVLKQ
jgi:hypothetical protein